MALVDVVGWAGTVGVLVAFAMISRNGVTARAQALNAVAGCALCWDFSAHHAWPGTALNFVWVAIASSWLVRDAVRESEA